MNIELEQKRAEAVLALQKANRREALMNKANGTFAITWKDLLSMLAFGTFVAIQFYDFKFSRGLSIFIISAIFVDFRSEISKLQQRVNALTELTINE